MKRIHRIACENPIEKLWNMFVYFESEQRVKSFLERLYKEKYKEEAARFAFQNTPKFIYYIKQGQQYFQTASSSSLLVKPMLLYYGMVSLLKAVVLASEARYPTHTKVLQHGLTSRKLKKLDYAFSNDETKIQREGLFPLVADILGCDILSGEKFIMKDLLAMLPELKEAYERTYSEVCLYPVYLSKQVDAFAPVTTFYLSEQVLDDLHLSYESFIHFLNRTNRGNAFFSAHDLESPKGVIRINWHHPKNMHVSESSDGFENDLFIQDYKGNHYFRAKQQTTSFIPEILAHYILMYTLGMICRYETERWGEMIFSFSSSEMFIIHEFLQINQRKFPNMIINLLFQEHFIFETA